MAGDPGGSFVGRASEREVGRRRLRSADHGHPQILLLTTARERGTVLTVDDPQ
ncbi:MAG TPA: hypothetical protein VFV32_08955 [Acidimicrobiales bacterium]|nr:hypothetical protein [Acidimicrobiales bacterium]